MTTRLPILLATSAALVALVGISGQLARADDDDDDGDEIRFDEANVFIELNDTDGDLGFHALIDGDPWKRLEIEDPDERELLFVRLTSRLRKQGLTEFFFESAEPTFDELSPEEFFDRFPEGEYELSGRTLDGEELESTAEFTHLVPAPVDGVTVDGEPAAADCDAKLPKVDAGQSVKIDWDPVTESHPDLGRTGEPIDVVQYQLVVEREEPTLLVLSVDLPPDQTNFKIPKEFIGLGDEFKFEILTREESGNQTAVESCFEVK